MKKHMLLNAMGVAALSLFCACTMMDKKEEAKPVEAAPTAEATQVPAEVTAQAPATNPETTPAAEAQAPVQAQADAVPAAPVAEQKA